jgi:hypothetical protein
MYKFIRYNLNIEFYLIPIVCKGLERNNFMLYLSVSSLSRLSKVKKVEYIVK